MNMMLRQFFISYLLIEFFILRSRVVSRVIEIPKYTIDMLILIYDDYRQSTLEYGRNEMMLQFIHSYDPMLGRGENGTRIAFIRCDAGAINIQEGVVVFSSTTTSNYDPIILEALKRMEVWQGFERIEECLPILPEYVFTEKNGDRPWAPNVIFLMHSCDSFVPNSSLHDRIKKTFKDSMVTLTVTFEPEETWDDKRYKSVVKPFLTGIGSNLIKSSSAAGLNVRKQLDSMLNLSLDVIDCEFVYIRNSTWNLEPDKCECIDLLTIVKNATPHWGVPCNSSAEKSKLYTCPCEYTSTNSSTSTTSTLTTRSLTTPQAQSQLMTMLTYLSIGVLAMVVIICINFVCCVHKKKRDEIKSDSQYSSFKSREAGRMSKLPSKRTPKVFTSSIGRSSVYQSSKSPTSSSSDYKGFSEFFTSSTPIGRSRSHPSSKSPPSPARDSTFSQLSYFPVIKQPVEIRPTTVHTSLVQPRVRLTKSPDQLSVRVQHST